MINIAITIDENTLHRVDRLVTGPGSAFKSRSELVRRALQEFVAGVEISIEEEREQEIFRRHRERLNRQATALVKEQARL